MLPHTISVEGTTCRDSRETSPGALALAYCLLIDEEAANQYHIAQRIFRTRLRGEGNIDDGFRR
jgi:hypothetical protein